MYDVTNPESFEAIDQWRKEFLLWQDKKKGNSIPFVLIGISISDNLSGNHYSSHFRQ